MTGMKSDVDHLHFLFQNMLSLNYLVGSYTSWSGDKINEIHPDQEMRSLKSILIRRWDPWNPSWSGEEIHEIHSDQEIRSMKSILIRRWDPWNPSWSLQSFMIRSRIPLILHKQESGSILPFSSRSWNWDTFYL